MPSDRAVSSKSPMEMRLLAVGSWLLVDIAVPDSSASLYTREKLLTAESAEDRRVPTENLETAKTKDRKVRTEPYTRRAKRFLLAGFATFQLKTLAVRDFFSAFSAISAVKSFCFHMLELRDRCPLKSSI